MSNKNAYESELRNVLILGASMATTRTKKNIYVLDRAYTDLGGALRDVKLAVRSASLRSRKDLLHARYLITVAKN